MLDAEREGRVALEIAASAAALRLAKGEKRLAAALWGNGAAELSMEAILILTELKTPFARTELARAAAAFSGDERRQAAIWGLGKSGLKSYADLVPFISDKEENVAYHAIAAFGSDTPRQRGRCSPQQRPLEEENPAVLAMPVLPTMMRRHNGRRGNERRRLPLAWRTWTDRAGSGAWHEPSPGSRVCPAELFCAGAHES
jgi:hypothetical protein